MTSLVPSPYFSCTLRGGGKSRAWYTLSAHTVKNAVYRNTPGEQYFTVSMVTHTVTTETVKYCSPGVFSYTAFFTVHAPNNYINESHHKSWHVMQYDKNYIDDYYGDIDGVWDASLALSIVGPGLP